MDYSVSIVQVREKNLTAGQLFDVVSEAVHETRGTRTLVLVNDRFDIALAAQADGVQLRSDSVHAHNVRAHVPVGFIIGVSAHSIEEVMSARDSRADFALLGPIFSTPGKSRNLGVGLLKQVCEAAAPFPVFALGGIDATNAHAAIAARAAGVAAIRFMNSQPGLEFARSLRNAER